MPRGGARPGAGRPKKGQSTVRRRDPAALRRAVLYVDAVDKQIRAGIEGAFANLTDDQLDLVTLHPTKMARKMYYVYGLIDPRDGKLFYVGKGQGPRAWSHATMKRDGSNSTKLKRIADIVAAGMQPEVRLLLRVPSEPTALAIEELLLKYVSNLENVVKTTGIARRHVELKRLRREVRRMRAQQRKLWALLKERGYDPEQARRLMVADKALDGLREAGKIKKP